MATQAVGKVTRVQPNAFGCITIPFLLIALIPLGWGARSQWSNRALLRDGEMVEGRVIELDHMPGNSSVRNGRGSAKSPVVTFTTRTGLARRMTGRVTGFVSRTTGGRAAPARPGGDSPPRHDRLRYPCARVDGP